MIDALIVSPARPDEQLGNAVTANRWRRMLERLGHRVEVATEYDGGERDVLIALHARRSAAAIKRFASERSDRPLVVALTGTDVYRDIETDASAQRSLHLATRLVVLQEAAVEVLPPQQRSKARVIHQSVEVPDDVGATPKADGFQACVMGHLRPVKDPLRTALAARLAPETSSLRVVHLGRALSPEMAEAARAEEATNPRYEWRGELPREDALRVLASSHVHVLTSHLEGGANAIGEAVVLGVPSLSTRISGSIGLLGADYPGFFPIGDEQRLAELLAECETNRGFLEELKAACSRRAPLFRPERELDAWRDLLEELAPPSRT